MKICSGGILGMGESVDDRAGLLIQLANLPEHPESVPINMLVKVKGTPLAEEKDVDPFDFIRTLAVARIMMPKSHVRLSAGREQMNEQMQALAFMAGANSIFYGEKLLTTANPRRTRTCSSSPASASSPRNARNTPTKCTRPPSSRPWWSSATPSCSITLPFEGSSSHRLQATSRDALPAFTCSLRLAA